MAQYVVMGASLMCSFGTAPSSLMVIRPTITIGGKPAATIMDYAPMSNIMPFAMCSSLANPQVAAATTAASGVLTPMPCIPNTVAPWIPGNPKVLIQNFPALMSDCKCLCLWAGNISISFAGQVTVTG